MCTTIEVASYCNNFELFVTLKPDKTNIYIYLQHDTINVTIYNNRK